MQNLLIPPASLLDDLELHMASPPSLGMNGHLGELATMMLNSNNLPN